MSEGRIINMGTAIKLKKYVLPTVAVVVFILVYLYVLSMNKSRELHQSIPYSWRPYVLKPYHDRKWFASTCLKSDFVPALEQLPSIMQTWGQSGDSECRQLYRVFTNIFTVTVNPSRVIIPESFADKVRKWLGNDEELFQQTKEQTVIFLFNEYTREQNVYNALRAKRPLAVPDQPEREYVDDVVKASVKSCDFCQYQKFTAEDLFGRIESLHSYSAANTFKLDTWHSLMILKKHHPLHWTQDEFLDLMNTTQKWFAKAHSRDKNYQYPCFVWDLLQHAGASQVHPHIHAFLDKTRYQGTMESWRMAVTEYNKDHFGRNYFTDLIQIHAALGLTVQYGQAVALANIVPKSKHEIVIISPKAGKDFFQLLYFVLRTYLDDLDKLCFSMAVSFPSMTGELTEASLPVLVRVVTRGVVSDVRSDRSSLELFTSPNVNTDPFELIKSVKESIRKRTVPVP